MDCKEITNKIKVLDGYSREVEHFLNTEFNELFLSRFEAIKEEIEALFQNELKEFLFISLEKAKKIFGRDFFGPEEIKNAYEFNTEIKYPPIPFSKKDLERAKNLGQFLILRTPEIDKAGFMFRDEIFLAHPRKDIKKPFPVHWALVSKGPMPKFIRYANYLALTNETISYLSEVFPLGLPDEYKKAIMDYKRLRPAIEALIDSNPQAGAKKLVELDLNKLTHPSLDQALYDMEIYHQITGRHLWDGYRDSIYWTNTQNASGEIATINWISDNEGVRVGSFKPGSCNVGRMRIFFSRTK